MRDSRGVRWLDLREAATETGMSRPTIMAWIGDGLESMRIRGKLWVPEPALFARLRASLADNPRVKTRWKNRQPD